jgi:hypothetical protein
MRRRSIFLGNQILSAGNEVVEDILFARKVAGRVPLFAVLGAAADIGIDENAALIEPDARELSLEKGLGADAVAAITSQQRGMRAVELRSLEANNVEGNAGAVFRGGEIADDFGIVEIDR